MKFRYKLQGLLQSADGEKYDEFLPAGICSKKSIFRIFWNEFSKTYKMLQAMKQDAQSASFLILIFSRESQNFSKNHIFHPEISVY